MKPVPEDQSSSEDKPDLRKDLSVTSQKFDIGHKGFLTQAEKAARSMDFNDEGHLSNEATVHLIERSEELSRANTNLRHWLIAVLMVTVVLGASQIATAIAAARLAKDTDTNSDSGVMFVKGSDKEVMVVPTGRVTVIDLDEDDSFCMLVSDVSDMFASTISGSPTTTVMRRQGSGDDEVGETEALQWAASGATYNHTKACIVSTNAVKYCFEYEPCRVGAESNNDDDVDKDESRHLAVVHERRMMFHQQMLRKLPSAYGGHDSSGGSSQQMQRRLQFDFDGCYYCGMYGRHGYEPSS